MHYFTLIVIAAFGFYFVIATYQGVRLFYPRHTGESITNTSIRSYWNDHTVFDVHVFFTTSTKMPTTRSSPKYRASGVQTYALRRQSNNVSSSYAQSVNVSVPSNARKLAYAHVLIGHTTSGTMSSIVRHVSIPMLAQRRISSNHTLYPHMLRSIRINVVGDHYNYTAGHVDDDLLSLLPIHTVGDRKYYLPLISVSEMVWASNHDYTLLNDSVQSVQVNITVDVCTLGWHRLSMQMSAAFKLMSTLMDQHDMDGLKYAFVHTNPKLMLITFIVSLLHSLFDLLAFKSDITYWRGRKQFGGISRRSMLLSTFCQIIILLYLFDRNTTILILGSSVLSTAISIWKISRLYRWRICRSGDDHDHDDNEDDDDAAGNAVTELERRTAQYDGEIMHYISYSMLPLLIGGCVYTYAFVSIGDKSVYSWVLESFARGVYMFGFFLMLPQLYVNYKLKSVAHLNWSRLVYAAINVFIDDLFAFIIVMPDLHFWSVFRDDVIFIVFMYQRFIYRTRTTTAVDDKEKVE